MRPCPISIYVGIHVPNSYNIAVKFIAFALAHCYGGSWTFATLEESRVW